MYDETRWQNVRQACDRVRRDRIQGGFLFSFLQSLIPAVSGPTVVNTEEHTLSLSPLPSGLVSEHEQICGQKRRMHYQMSVIYGHPVIAATRALRSPTT